MRACTVVLQFNYGPPRSSLGSVWVFAGDGREDLASDSELEELAGWRKSVGPVDYDLASGIQREIVLFMRAAGVEVFDEGVAD
jgi:hypothetical protein